MKRGVLIGVIVAVAASPASALATQRYASPSGSGTACTAAAPCDIVEAINNAFDSDEVLLAGNGGSYGSFGSPLTTSLTLPPDVTVHGIAGQARPVIYSSAFTALDLTNGSVLRSVEVHSVGSPTYGISAVAVGSPAATIDHAAAYGGSNAACILYGVVMTDSVCDDPHGYGVFDGSGFGSGTVDVTIRNSTLVGGGTSGNRGLAVNLNSGDAMHLNATNTIIRGSGEDIYTQAADPGSLVVTLDHCNYAAVTAGVNSSVTPAGSGTNQTAAPAFVNAASGDVHEAAGSPTIDAGVVSPLNGTTDLDGNPRTLGASTDIGAYEFMPPLKPPVAPVISGLKLKKHHKKRTVSYSDTEAGSVKFTIYKLKHGKRKLVRSFTKSDLAGSNSFTLKGKKLKKGKYLLVALPSAGGLTGASASVNFRVG